MRCAIRVHIIYPNGEVDSIYAQAAKGAEMPLILDARPIELPLAWSKSTTREDFVKAARSLLSALGFAEARAINIDTCARDPAKHSRFVRELFPESCVDYMDYVIHEDVKELVMEWYKSRR